MLSWWVARGILKAGILLLFAKGPHECMGPAASGTPAANICAVASCSAVVGPPKVPEGRNGSLFYWSYTASLMQVPFLPVSEGSEASGHLFASTPFSFVALVSFLPDGIATGKCDYFFLNQCHVTRTSSLWNCMAGQMKTSLWAGLSRVSSKSSHVRCQEISLRGHSRPTLPSPVTAISQGGG